MAEAKERGWKEINSAKDVTGDLDFIRLRIALDAEGVRLHESALAGIGTLYSEQTHSGNFEEDFAFHKGALHPHGLVLPYSPDRVNELDGTLESGITAPCHINEKSPFVLRRSNGKLVLEKNGNFLTEVCFARRPEYWNKRTSDGIPMSKIGERIAYSLTFTVSKYCELFKDGSECRFCNMNPTTEVYRDEVVVQKRPKHVAETVSAARDDPSVLVTWVNLSGGLLPRRHDLQTYLETGKAIKAMPNCKDLPVNGAAAGLTPDRFSELERLKEAGFTSVGINLELWNRHFFAGVCPGKEKVGYDNWIKTQERAVEVFGFGNVRSFLITGIEPAEESLKGFEALTRKGIIVCLSRLRPQVGSSYEGHTSPHPGWHYELCEKAADILQNSRFTLEMVSHIPFYLTYDPFQIWRIREGKRMEDLVPALKERKRLQAQGSSL